MSSATVTYAHDHEMEAAASVAEHMERAGFQVRINRAREPRVIVGEHVWTWDMAKTQFPAAPPAPAVQTTFEVQRLSETAILPTRGSPAAAALDLYYDGAEDVYFLEGDRRVLSTGIAMTAPEGCYARIAPRSGLAVKGFDTLGGVIDRDYTGELKVILIWHGPMSREEGEDGVGVIRQGDRIAQVIFERCVLADPVEVPELAATQRGESGFGSTGN